MDDSEKIYPTWGYHRSEPARIFDLKEGEELPSGWKDTPAAFEKSKASDPDATLGPVAEHRGGGRYFVMIDGKPVGDAMSKEDAEAFNALSASDKSALLAKG